MAYFDSPKNRALWEKTMVGLRAERERRRATGYAPTNESGARHAESMNPYRRKINLAELEEIERQAEGVRRVPRPSRQARAGLRMEQGALQQDELQTGGGLQPDADFMMQNAAGWQPDAAVPGQEPWPAGAGLQPEQSFLQPGARKERSARPEAARSSPGV